MQFAFDKEKNDLLFKRCGFTFSIVIEAIAEKGVLLNFDHPNQRTHLNQEVFVVDLNGYPESENAR